MKNVKQVFMAVAMLIIANQASALCFWPMDCKAYKTQHPIVLIHGVSGFNEILGIDYFYGVKNALENRGATVYAPNVTAWHDAYERGEQLLAYLEDLKATTGAEKFNLIGHSLGGPTSRYVAGVKPELVASVTTVNAVNFGSDFADVGQGIISYDGNLEAFAATVLNALGDVIDAMSGNPEYTQDALASVQFMTSQGAAEFNALFPDGQPTARCGEGPSDVNDVRYYSWGGDATSTDATDISDAFFMLTGSVIDGPNDGLVERCDQHWGQVIGTDFNMNHADAVNHLFGITHLFETDPLTLYKNQAARLKRAGL